MTYNDITSSFSNNKNTSYGYVENWMAYDIAALQYLYGKTNKTLTNDVYYIKNDN